MIKNYKEQGFTLIELLIVIVIIGILSGVLIAVINPVRQQNRSRNAAIKAAINKSAFAINTARAGLGRLPYDTELNTELENFTAVGTSCEDADALSCQFNLAGTILPQTCDASGYYGHAGAGEQCTMYVVSPNPAGAQFRVIAKAYKLSPGTDEATESSSIYVFDSSEGFFECPSATDAGGIADGSFTVSSIASEEGCVAESAN